MFSGISDLPGTPPHRDFSNLKADCEAKKALAWMQSDVERRAREIKETYDKIDYAVLAINEAIAGLDPDSESALCAVCDRTRSSNLSTTNVDELVGQWMRILNKWSAKERERKHEFGQRFAAFREECESRLQVLEATHQREYQQISAHLELERAATNQLQSMLLPNCPFANDTALNADVVITR